MIVKMKKFRQVNLLLVFCAAAFIALASGERASADTERIVCTDTMLKLDVKNVTPMTLITMIGDTCGIKVVVFGEVSDNNPIAVTFQQLPIRKGIERVLRISNLPNFVLHFDNNTETPRIVELDIMGAKGGERQLTSGKGRPAAVAADRPAAPGSRPAPTASRSKTPPAPAVSEKAPGKPPAVDPKDVFSEKAQEDFMKVMDEMMKAQEMGEDPDPAEVLRIFKEVVPPEIREQIPPEVLKELEDLEDNPSMLQGMPPLPNLR